MSNRLSPEELAEMHDVGALLDELAEVTRERDEARATLYNRTVERDCARAAGFEEAREATLRICRKADNDCATIEWIEDEIRQLKPAGGETKP